MTPSDQASVREVALREAAALVREWHPRGTANLIADDIEALIDAPVEAWPECSEFYNLMQAYRFASVTSPVRVKAAYESVKSWLRVGHPAPDPPSDEATAELLRAARSANWQQVIMNGGPPCFHLEGRHFCLRAETWQGHTTDKDEWPYHKFISLEALLAAPRTEGK